MRPELDETQPATPASDRTLTQGPGATAPAPAMGGIAPGAQLGHFRIDRPLGAGGMGEVYLATDLALDRPVAIKVLPEAVARDPARRDRMIREARAQARLSHPNVGHIYFIGEDHDRLYFAMEYVAGETVAERLARGPMSVDEAIAVIRGAALGLREAQRHGITHRDVKPSNLMIDEHGMVKVLDFGLAAGDLERGAAGPVAQTSLAGTPLYMAPEQARGEAIDLRADIYALGTTLYHLVAGRPPFQADSVDELVSMHATAARPGVQRRGLRRVQVGQLDALCARMMAARPDDRFASYDELVRALDLASIAHTRPGGFWARTIALAIDGIALSLLGVIAQAILQATTDDLVIEGDLMLPAVLALQVVTIARWGTTPGKAMMELEVIDVEAGRRPGWAGSARRGLAMLGLPCAAIAAEHALGPVGQHALAEVSGLIAVLASLLAFAALAYAALRAPGKRTWWDRAGRTMVRYRTTRATLEPPC